MIASVGDYIIKGVKGEFYPCKPDIFEATYHEMVEEQTIEMSTLENPLFRRKYTTVKVEKEFHYNAPHHFEVVDSADGKSLLKIHFQEGPIKECGVNGVMNEDLLLMVLERLYGFQKSEYKCRENAVAITKIEEAVMWLGKRTVGREQKGIEGTHQVG